MVRLHQRRVDALEPRETAYDVRDDDLKGFGVRVLPSGGKRYFVHSQRDGRRVWKIVGKDIAEAEARARAKAVLAGIRSGTPPVERMSFEAAAEEVALRAELETAHARGQPRQEADPAVVRGALDRRDNAAGRPALVRFAACDARGGGPVGAGSVGHHAAGGGLRLPAGGQQPVRGHPALPAAGARTVPDGSGDPPSRGGSGRPRTRR